LKTEYNKYHLIDRYLRKELSAEELRDFETLLLTDTEFAEEVSFQQEVNELISADAYHDLRQEIFRDIKEIRHKNIPDNSNRNILIAAILLLAALTGLIYYFSSGKKDESTLNRTESVIKENQFWKEKNKADNTVLSYSEPSSAIKKLSGKTPQNTDIPVEHNDSNTIEQQLVTITNAEKSKADTGSPDEKQKNTAVYTDTNTSIQLKGKPELPASPCTGIKPEASWYKENACAGKNDGKFIPDKKSLKGGKPPYATELTLKSQKIDPDKFDQLQAGHYYFKITDANGCSAVWNILINEKNCRTAAVSISPDHGDKWEYQGNEGNSYYLCIFNQSGQQVFRSSLLNGHTEWAGTDNSGNRVNTGLFIYIVEYTDGKKESGQITVIQ
jgi:hypothetical protein